MADTPDFNAFNRSVIAEFRNNDGAVSGPFAGAPLLLLTTTGDQLERAFRRASSRRPESR